MPAAPLAPPPAPAGGSVMLPSQALGRRDRRPVCMGRKEGAAAIPTLFLLALLFMPTPFQENLGQQQAVTCLGGGKVPAPARWDGRWVLQDGGG